MTQCPDKAPSPRKPCGCLNRLAANITRARRVVVDCVAAKTPVHAVMPFPVQQGPLALALFTASPSATDQVTRAPPGQVWHNKGSTGDGAHPRTAGLTIGTLTVPGYRARRF